MQLGANRGVMIGVIRAWEGSIFAMCEIVARVSAREEATEASR